MTNDLNFTNEIPDGFVLEHDQVEPEVWANIQRWLSSESLPSSAKDPKGASTSGSDGDNFTRVPIPWQPGSQGRRVAQFGSCRYDYIADVAEECNPSDNPIPDYIRETLLSGVPNCEQYTQCIINRYEASNLIPWHFDHPYFGPEVLVYTFGEERPLLLRKMTEGNQEEENTYVYSRAFPRHCSKYLLSGPARDVWEHSVPGGTSKRVSITFRSWVGPK